MGSSAVSTAALDAMCRKISAVTQLAVVLGELVELNVARGRATARMDLDRVDVWAKGYWG